jgi:hypothetical protein
MKNYAREQGAVVWRLRRSGMSLKEVAAEMTRRRIETPKGKSKWVAETVSSVLRLSEPEVSPGVEPIVGPRRVRANRRAMELAPILWELKAAGRTNPQIAGELDRRGVLPPKGGKWHLEGVRQIFSISAGKFESFAEAAEANPHHNTIRARAFAEAVGPIAWGLRSSGKTLAAVDAEMNRQNLKTPRKGEWCIARVWRLLQETASAFDPVWKAA